MGGHFAVDDVARNEHDCGAVINPLILAGQIHGGVALGIGNAFYEQLVFDEQGQLINASLAWPKSGTIIRG